MAGIYVHVPFCRSRCIYCDFYSTTREEAMAAYTDALCCELKGRQAELANEHVGTIYFGGGTPSLLPSSLLQRIIDTICIHYDVAEDAEITLEMNPDDSVDVATLSRINRISLGVQTFNDELLRLLRRRHDSATAIAAVKKLQAAGIGNISIDLIYGLPGQTMETWEHDLQQAFTLGIQHLSAYALSYEEGTLLSRWREAGKIQEASDELEVAMFERLCQCARKAGFEHYEISNFALPHFYSHHNSSYWTGSPYAGFGPGAHSYDGVRTRRANRPDLSRYLQLMTHEGVNPMTDEQLADFEQLSTAELYDEAVMCGLRTSRGIDLAHLKERFGEARLQELLNQAQTHLRQGRLKLTDGFLRLTEQSLMISDDIMSDLMAVSA